MQRTSGVLEDRADDRVDVGDWVDVTELIARISAERGAPIADTGRHHHARTAPPVRRPRRMTPALAGLVIVLVTAAVVLGVRAGAGTAAEGVQAARVHGWALVERDEFAGVVGTGWSRHDSVGRDGNERRVPEAVGVRNGALVIRGDAQGASGGVSWHDGRETGRWEMRARFPKGDARYHPVLMLWPASARSDDGEIDFAETTSASDSVSFFLDHGPGERLSATKQLDVTQWHNYAVEVTADRVTGYVDGQKWFESTDRDTLPRGPVHPVIQLDLFPNGDPPEPSELLVDWMRVYE